MSASRVGGAAARPVVLRYATRCFVSAARCRAVSWPLLPSAADLIGPAVLAEAVDLVGLTVVPAMPR